MKRYLPWTILTALLILLPIQAARAAAVTEIDDEEYAVYGAALGSLEFHTVALAVIESEGINLKTCGACNREACRRIEAAGRQHHGAANCGIRHGSAPGHPRS